MSSLQQLELLQDPNVLMIRSKSKGETKYFVTKIRPTDVLFGRGSGPNDHVGNIRFRQYVAERKGQYMATNHRLTKTKIAREIVELLIIQQDRGRFLKKMEASSELRDFGLPENNGIDYYELVDDETIMEKAKQALRQGSTTSTSTGTQIQTTTTTPLPVSTSGTSTTASSGSTTTASTNSASPIPSSSQSSKDTTALTHTSEPSSNTSDEYDLDGQYVDLSPLPVSSGLLMAPNDSVIKTAKSNNVSGINKNSASGMMNHVNIPFTNLHHLQQRQPRDSSDLNTATSTFNTSTAAAAATAAEDEIDLLPVYDIEPLPLVSTSQVSSPSRGHAQQYSHGGEPVHQIAVQVSPHCQRPVPAFDNDEWDTGYSRNDDNNINVTMPLNHQQHASSIDPVSMQQYSYMRRQQQQQYQLQQLKLQELKLQEQKIQQLQRQILLEQQQVAVDAVTASMYHNNTIQEDDISDNLFIQQQRLQIQQRQMYAPYPLSMSARRAQQQQQQHHQRSPMIQHQNTQHQHEQFSNYNSSMAQLPHEDVTPFANLRQSMTIRDLEKGRALDKRNTTNSCASNNLSMSFQQIQSDRRCGIGYSGQIDSAVTMDELMDSFNQMRTPSMSAGVGDSVPNNSSNYNVSGSNVLSSPNNPQNMLSGHLHSRMMASTDTMGTIDTMGSVNDMSVMMESSTFSLFREPSINISVSNISSNNISSTLNVEQKLDYAANEIGDGKAPSPNDSKIQEDETLQSKNMPATSKVSSQNSFRLSDITFLSDSTRNFLGDSTRQGGNMNHDSSTDGVNSRTNSKSSTNFSFTSKSIAYLNNTVQQQQQMTEEGDNIATLPRTIDLAVFEHPIDNDDDDNYDHINDDNDD